MNEERRQDYPNILEKLDTINKSMTDIEIKVSMTVIKVDNLKERVDKHSKENKEHYKSMDERFFGNGSTGLITQVKMNKQALDKIEKKSNFRVGKIMDYAFKIGVLLFAYWLGTK